MRFLIHYKRKFVLFGAIWERHVITIEYIDRYKTQIGIFPPQIPKEAVQLKFWGYNKLDGEE